MYSMFLKHRESANFHNYEILMEEVKRIWVFGRGKFIFEELQQCEVECRLGSLRLLRILNIESTDELLNQTYNRITDI